MTKKSGETKWLVEDFAYLPMRKRFRLQAKSRSQVLDVALPSRSASEEVYRQRLHEEGRSRLFADVPADASTAFIEACIDHLEESILSGQNVCDSSYIRNVADMHLGPHLNVSLDDLEVSMVSVRVSNEKLQQQSRSQLTTARECLRQSMWMGALPLYIVSDAESGQELHRVGIRLAIDLAYLRKIHHLVFAVTDRAFRDIFGGIDGLRLIHALGIKIWLRPKMSYHAQRIDLSSQIDQVLLAHELATSQEERSTGLIRSERTAAEKLLDHQRWPYRELGRKFFLQIPRDAAWNHGWPVERKRDAEREALAFHALMTSFGPRAHQYVGWLYGTPTNEVPEKLEKSMLDGSLSKPASRAIENRVKGLQLYTDDDVDALLQSMASREDRGGRQWVDDEFGMLTHYREEFALMDRYIASQGAETVRCKHCEDGPPMEFTGYAGRGIDRAAEFRCPRGHAREVPDRATKRRLLDLAGPGCPYCGNAAGCRLVNEVVEFVSETADGAGTRRTTYWYECPICEAPFPLPWKHARELAKVWLQQRTMANQVATVAARSGWDLLGIAYGSSGHRRPWFKEAGQHRIPSERGYWLIEDLATLAAFHLRSVPDMNHSPESLCEMFRGAVADNESGPLHESDRDVILAIGQMARRILRTTMEVEWLRVGMLRDWTFSTRRLGGREHD